MKFVGVEEFKKYYDFASHSSTPIDLSLLEFMVQKLEARLPEHLQTDDTKAYLNKQSSYSRRQKLPLTCKIKRTCTK